MLHPERAGCACFAIRYEIVLGCVELDSESLDIIVAGAHEPLPEHSIRQAGKKEIIHAACALFMIKGNGGSELDPALTPSIHLTHGLRKGFFFVMYSLHGGSGTF